MSDKFTNTNIDEECCCERCQMCAHCPFQNNIVGRDIIQLKNNIILKGLVPLKNCLRTLQKSQIIEAQKT
jgi:hypothetical protein